MRHRFNTKDTVRDVKTFLILACLGMLTAMVQPAVAVDGSRFAHSDSDARYLHYIDLYDASNRKITPDSTSPYSTLTTCGRCHDYETISHGWHFNAGFPDAHTGRPGEPWIWTDARTGTQLPLSYRTWPHTYHPDTVGISRWQMTKYFGGRLPGGALTTAPDPSASGPDQTGPAGQRSDGDDAPSDAESRWQLTGSLTIDCMACHAASGSYDFNARRQQIETENFAFAATAALRLGTVKGSTAGVRSDADIEEEAVKRRLPQLTYDASRFGPDGTVFMDILRQPQPNACYQCHSQRVVSTDGIVARWNHDQDVHLRAGMSCVDCHRNGIDHHIVRGFPGEQHPNGAPIETLSCAGCHLGAGQEQAVGDAGQDITRRAGRLGSPRPRHAGLPPIHFEKLSCTACHGGPVPREEALRIMTSLAHGLGDSGHRSGRELPAIVGPVYVKGADGRIVPQRAMWPAFWGVLQNSGGETTVRPLPPERVYDITRRSLRVRKDFQEEVLEAKLSRGQLVQILGEERGPMEPEQWTEEEQASVEAAKQEQSAEQFAAKASAALEAIEAQLDIERAAYVSGGVAYVRGAEAASLQQVELDSDDLATSMITWPIAHPVRPAGWSLGVAGCAECHSRDALLFTSTVAPVGPGPEAPPPLTMAALQGLDEDQRLAWNELFSGRGNFKYVLATSLAVLAVILLIGLGAIAARLAARDHRIEA